jgi:hypothetical protein
MDGAEGGSGEIGVREYKVAGTWEEQVEVSSSQNCIVFENLGRIPRWRLEGGSRKRAF